MEIWLRGCLWSTSFAVLVNGNAKGWIQASRGLRLGLAKFDATRKHDTNMTGVLRVWVEYNHVLVKSVFITHLINGLYSCQST